MQARNLQSLPISVQICWDRLASAGLADPTHKMGLKPWVLASVYAHPLGTRYNMPPTIRFPTIANRSQAYGRQFASRLQVG